MNNRHVLFAGVLLAAAAMLVSCGNTSRSNKAIASTQVTDDTAPASVVYFTREITPESLVKVYEALGREATGRVAVKISTGEMGGHNYLKPELIAPLLKKVNGTLVECNTAYIASKLRIVDGIALFLSIPSRAV